ncbi:MAG: histone deacetylase [Gemmatimonadales bacterium]|nr:histone deacetylase [Gemmatimonadales bacterium]
MWKGIKNIFRSRNTSGDLRFVIHRRYLLDLPFPQYDARRPFRILSYLEKRNLLRRGMLRRPRPVSLRRLKAVHDHEYLHSLENPGALETVLGFSLDPAGQDKFLCFQRLMCGGTLRATRNALRRGGVSVNLGGGFHHASPAAGSGFCVFNDVAIAVASLRKRGFDAPILVVDLDLHDGDGTRAFFADDPTVHTFSIHNQDLGNTRAVASTSLALGPDVDDKTYLDALRNHLPPVLEEVQPGFVFYLAGSDPGITDHLGDWRISLDGMLARDRFVMERLGPETPCVILLAGGYGPRAWRHGAAFFSWLLTGSADLDIPLELELPVDHYRRLTRWMKNPKFLQDEKGDGRSEQDWGLSEKDLGLTGAKRPQLFLDIFSRHAVEMALEEYGLLNRLRRLGFDGLRVAMDLSDPAGHTLRILTADDEPLTLMELRLRIDRTSEPGRAYLSVEWLLIQDAGSRFEMSRPLLPGQKYPGLGLLRNTAAVLVVLCERLDLDGLVSTPSHYHLASLARPLARDRDPEREGYFQAIQQSVVGLPLKEAAEAVENGRVLEFPSEHPVRWKPARLVIPVSKRCKAHFDSPIYREEAARALTEWRFKLSEKR